MNTLILDFLNSYADNTNPQYAVMLKGKWGCGKTHLTILGLRASGIPVTSLLPSGTTTYRKAYRQAQLHVAKSRHFYGNRHCLDDVLFFFKDELQ